jgi:5'-3' exoribonuclease 1
MGIPSFFQHIIKNYDEIFDRLKKVKSTKKQTNLYLDSNSIIYDVLSKIEFTTKEEYEFNICNSVCNKIDEYIKLLEPSGLVIIAIDGLAPVAKMDQQRTRRFKSNIISELERKILKKDTPTLWDKASITPGTYFMSKLDLTIRNYFNNYKLNNKKVKVLFSGSNEEGEGEHKIFSYIRKHKEYHKNTQTYIYGLDADLIILSLNHLYLCNNIYLFREKPEYDTKLSEIYKDEEHCFMKIKGLEDSIVETMVNENNNEYNKENKIKDYCFLSFFLGNDFLPHNPTLNIRTHGLDILIESYKKIISNNKSICNGLNINWKLLKKLIKEIGNNEKLYLENEYRIMKKQHYRYKNSEEKDEIKKLNNKPQYNRDVEIYINPTKEYWKERYYEELFDIDNYISEDNKRVIKNKDDKILKEVCINYIEGLEWIWKYYSSDCINNVWYYKYDYPPLFSDLVKYIPDFDMELIDKDIFRFGNNTQLAYVLPPSSYGLLNDKVKDYMLSSYNKEEIKLKTTYCKYLWESHVDLENIDIFELDYNLKKLNTN